MSTRQKKEYINNTMYGDIQFIKEIGKDKRGRIGLFKCFCGNLFNKVIYQITSSNCTSCGCKITKNTSPEYRGSTFKPEYKVWNNLLTRCNNPKANNYHRYGGRGIKVDKNWYKFSEFYKDMGDRPSKNHSIERINNDGDYCKENCKWATKEEQVRNRSTNIIVTYNGENKILKDLARENNMDFQKLQRRLLKGMSIDRAIRNDINYKRK